MAKNKVEKLEKEIERGQWKKVINMVELKTSIG